MDTDMTERQRKFTGIIMTVIYVTAYALVLMAVGARFVVGNGLPAELAFYVIGGLAWLPLEMVIVRWMSKPD